MIIFSYLELNFFALLVLLLIYLNIRHYRDKYLFDQKLFIALMASNALMLILDSVMWAIDGRTGVFASGANQTFTLLYYLAHPLPCLLWSMYAHFLVYRNKKALKRLMIPLLLPVFVNAVLAAMSLSKGYVFYFDQDNFYHRGPYFLVVVMIYFAYLIYTFIFVLVKHKKFTEGHYLPILLFMAAPVIGGFLQVMFYGLSLIWSAVTISILIIFINTQNGLLSIDYLTGLYNRRQLDSYLEERIRRGDRNTLLVGLMIDLDSFKEINDKHGHTAGDKALVDMGKILRMSFRKDDLICRYGGDEFVVIAEMEKETDFRQFLDRLERNALKFREKEKSAFSIFFSMGYAAYDWNSGATAQDFIKKIDGIMYENKNQARQNNIN